MFGIPAGTVTIHDDGTATVISKIRWLIVMNENGFLLSIFQKKKEPNDNVSIITINGYFTDRTYPFSVFIFNLTKSDFNKFNLFLREISRVILLGVTGLIRFTEDHFATNTTARNIRSTLLKSTGGCAIRITNVDARYRDTASF